MPQLAKNALQTERVYLLLRGENRPNSTYKAPKFHANSPPNIQCLPQCGLFSPFVRTARFWVTEWGNQILTNMNIVGIDMLYKPQ